VVLAPFLFKAKAIQSLKGNWQTALLITFFSGILTTGTSLAYSVLVPDPASFRTYEALLAAVEKIPDSTWILLSVLNLLSFFINPMLQLGANHYFVSRLQGLDLGFGGLFSRVRHWGKALWLSILIGVKVFLWSLLLIVPGIIAAIRYSMAYYYLAEDPSLTAWEAVEKSKNAMRNTKMSYLALTVSFFGWLLMSMLIPQLLVSMSFILAQVVSLCLNLFINTYMNGAFASFYSAVSDPQGLERLHRSAASMMGSSTGSPFGAFGTWMGSQEDREPPEDAEEDEDKSEEEPSEAGEPSETEESQDGLSDKSPSDDSPKS
jgi:uncharacterized membrane protein